MDKRNLLLERDFLLFDPWDAIKNPPLERSYSGPLHDGYMFGKNSAIGITLSIYGTFGTSDLTGEEIIEDMEVWLGDGEITNGLSETFLQRLVSDCIDEHTLI